MKTLIVTLFFIIQTALAVDNPKHQELESFIKGFNQKYEKFENATSTSQMAKALSEAEVFCQKELKIAMETLEKKRSKEEMKKIKEAQEKWEKYKTSEFDALSVRFKQSSGSSSRIDHLQKRVEVLKNRTHYLYSLLK